MRLARIFHKIDRLSACGMRCHRLSMAQFDVLTHVGARDGITQQQLADSLLVTKGNICQLLDRMESSGLLVRRQQGRANCLSLTAEGRKLYEEIVPAHETVIDRAMSTLTPREQTQLLALLRKLDRGLAGEEPNEPLAHPIV
jgi:DNA-binding MarR family transcriptional regulator